MGRVQGQAQVLVGPWVFKILNLAKTIFFKIVLCTLYIKRRVESSVQQLGTTGQRPEAHTLFSQQA
jgi:hypothetical protein